MLRLFCSTIYNIMRKRFNIKKNWLIYSNFKKNEIYKLLLQYFIKRWFFCKYICLKKLDLLKNNKYSLSYIYKICLFTGRTRSIYNQFRVSRINLKLESALGLILGLKKSTWYLDYIIWIFFLTLRDQAVSIWVVIWYIYFYIYWFFVSIYFMCYFSFMLYCFLDWWHNKRV